MESAGEKAEVPVQSTTAPSEAEKPAENKDPEPQATTEDPSAGIKVRNTSTYNIPVLTTKTYIKKCLFCTFPNYFFSSRQCFRMVDSMKMSCVLKLEILSL